MKIENTLKIVTKLDYCSIERKEKGTVAIGSVTLQPDEIEDFPKLLATALKVLPSTTVDGKPI